MSWTRLTILIGTLVYTSALRWVYPAVLVPAFGYAGMSFRLQRLPDIVLQIALAWLPALWLPKELNKPSQYQNWILYLTVIVPSCIVPYHVTSLPPATIHLYVALLIICFAGLCTVSLIPSINVTMMAVSWPVYGFLLATITVMTYGGLVVYLGLPSVFLPIDKVYDLRSELRSANLPMILNYLIWWQGSAINPIISSIGFAYRQPALIAVSALLQIELYSISSLRTFLAAAAFQIGIGLFFRIVHRQRGAAFLYSILASVVVATGWFFMDRHAIGPLLLLDRWIFNAGQLSGYYLEFFSQHPAAGLQHSSFGFLRLLFPGPYDLPVGQIIGREYFIQFSDGTYSNATAHFWADGFAAFGYLGIVAVTLIAGFSLWLVDNACYRIAPMIAIMAYAIVAMSMIGQSILTTVLTGGLAPLIFMLMLMPKNRSGMTLLNKPREN